MSVCEVTDLADPRLADYHRLTDRSFREQREHEGGLYIAETEKVIERAVAAGHRVRSVMTQQRWVPTLRSLLDDAVPIFVVPDAVAEGVTGYAVHRGALAAMHRPELPTVEELASTSRTVLLVENVMDHTNVGAVFRAAAALGADAVLVSANCGDPLYRRSVRVSMGGVFQVPWTRFTTVSEIRPALQRNGFMIAALALSDDAVSLDAFAETPTEKIALAIGAEGPGLTADALTSADRIVTIPMRAGVDSLNVASAAAVALWEVTRAARRSP